MNYFLVLGMCYQKYKKSARISVFLGERLIDCFELDVDHPPAEFQYHQLYKSYIQKFALYQERIAEGFTIPNFYKVYKLKESEIGNELKIIIQNSNNNYTNGFMTKNSLIMFPTIALFPASMTTNNAESLISRISRLRVAFEKAMERFETDKRFTRLNGLKEHIPLSKITDEKHTPKQYWPSVNWMKIKSNSKSISDGLHDKYTWLGGDFELHINVRKKYGIKYLHTPGTTNHGFWIAHNMDYLLPAAKNLLNIYDEDQRSNHTKD